MTEPAAKIEVKRKPNGETEITYSARWPEGFAYRTSAVIKPGDDRQGIIDGLINEGRRAYAFSRAQYLQGIQLEIELNPERYSHKELDK